MPIEQFLNLAAMTPELSIDTETNGEDVRDGRGYCQGISMAFMWRPGKMAATYLPIRHARGFNYDAGIREKIRDVLEFRDEQRLPNIYHNSKFDVVSLRTTGNKLRFNHHYCTMIMSHLMDENAYCDSLDAVSGRWLGAERGKVKSELFNSVLKAVGWAGIPSELMYEYGTTDAGLPLLIKEQMTGEWQAERLENYWTSHKLNTINTFINMERRGVLIDQELCKKNVFIGEEEMGDIAYRLGGAPTGNFLKYLILEQLKLPVVRVSQVTGKPSFNKEAMEQYEEILANRNDVTASLILAYRGWQKTVSSNYRAYLDLLSPDGRLRCNYKLHGTRTGRVSCEKPNLQQIPRESTKPWNGATKKAFVGPDNYSIIGLDYSQLEFRIGASRPYANEEKLIDIFNDPSKDVFTEMARIEDWERQNIKTRTYSVAYGAGVNRIANVFGKSREEARQIIDTYYATYPGFRRISNLASGTCKSRGKIKLWSGRYRHFMFPKTQGHKAFNSACQGGAADIVEDRMAAVDKALGDNADCQLLLQVHDELIFQVRTDKIDKYIPDIKEMMQDVPGEWGVKFRVESKQING